MTTTRPNTEYFRREKARFRTQGQQDDAPCWICGQPIDYTAPAGDPEAHTLDHLHPFKTHPELHDDPANWRHAHHKCNASRGTRPPVKECETLPKWW